MPVLVGIRRRTCIKRYAAVPLKTEYAHELALRILLGSAVREAAAHNMGLNPLLSFSVDHYVRTYCEALEGDEATWHAVTQLGFINHCDACGVRFSTPGLIPEQITCPQCQNTPLRIAGPLWIGKFGDKAFINEVIKQVTQFTLGTKRRTTSLLNKLQDEVDGPPTYFNLHHLADKLNIPVPPFSQIIDQLRASGEVCTRTHFSDHAIRTTASESAITQLLLKLNSEL